MDDLLSYDTILFPADVRQPLIVELPATPVTQTDPLTGQLVLVSFFPHPGVHMDGIADDPSRRAWGWQVSSSSRHLTLANRT